MSPTKQNKLIAEICGLNPDSFDFVHDLNAMQVAESYLSYHKVQLWDEATQQHLTISAKLSYYGRTLPYVTHKAKPQHGNRVTTINHKTQSIAGGWSRELDISALPNQRAEAFLRTFNLWEEPS